MRSTMTKAAVGSRLSTRRALPLLQAATGAALFAIAAAGPAHAQSTGVAACDDFLQKYDVCVTSKLPEAQRATYKAQLDQTRKTWIDMAKNPSAKSTMEGTCKQTMDAMKASLQSFGCSF
jgi:hypothetical protein